MLKILSNEFYIIKLDIILIDTKVLLLSRMIKRHLQYTKTLTQHPNILKVT